MRTFLRMRKDIDDATWFDTALRYAAPYGLEKEVTAYYEMFIKEGMQPNEAAYEACYEWDLLDLVIIEDDGTEREVEK